MKIPRTFEATAIMILIAGLAFSCTNHWPQFRGPESNMIPKVKNLPEEWGNGQNIRWKHPLSGKGWSSPIIWGNRVFITEAILDETSLPPDTALSGEANRVNPPEGIYRWMVYCLDLESGELLWDRIAYEGKPGIPTHRDNTYASETPVTDGEMVYAYFGMTGMFCYDFDGNLIWEKDLVSCQLDYVC